MPLLLRMATYDTYTEGDGPALPIVIPGALLVQALWEYPAGASDMFAASLLGLGTEGVVALTMHPQGSRVVEAFIKGQADPARKRKLTKLLKGAWGKLATDKYGSHVVEACYAAADIKTKEAIGDELLETGEALKQDTYGRKVVCLGRHGGGR